MLLLLFNAGPAVAESPLAITGRAARAVGVTVSIDSLMDIAASAPARVVGVVTMVEGMTA